MNQFTKFVGMDVHKATIAVSVAESGGAEVRYLGEIANTAEAMTKLVRQLRKGDAALSFCYEAGPCGYGLHRQLTELGWDCQVVAPSLIPKKSGDRVKTDRRDSMMLARLHRAGELTAVWVPDDAQEALRDLTRAREDMKSLELKAKQRLSAFLLRYGKSYGGKSNWTQAHFRWLEGMKFTQPVQQIVFQEYVDTVKAMGKRVDGMEQQLDVAARASAFWPVIEALMALRGVALLAATIIVAEIGDLHRFASAPQLMAYLGLVPSEHSSGATKSRGSITKTGNGHVRRVTGRSGMDLSPSSPQDGLPAATRRARSRGGAGDRVERTKTPVRALPAHGGKGQAEGSGLHGGGTRTRRLHLGHWTHHATSGSHRINGA